MFAGTTVFTCKNDNIAAPPRSSVVKLNYCSCHALKMTHPKVMQDLLGDFFDFSVFKPFWTIIAQHSAWQHLAARAFVADIHSNQGLTPFLQVGSSSPARSCRSLLEN